MPGLRSIKVIVPVAVLLAVVSTTAVVGVVVRNSGGPVTAVRAVTETVWTYTTSTTYTDVPGMSTSLTVPSGERAFVIVTFSGHSICADYSSGSDTAMCLLRVVVNGVAARPDDVWFDSAADNAGTIANLSGEANSMQFVAGPLTAGTHVIKVQYKLDKANSKFELGDRTLTVLRF